MRQVNLKILRARLTQELKSLPFEITKNGKVVGVVTKGLNKSYPIDNPKNLSTQNNTTKTTSPIGGRQKEKVWFNPLENSSLAPKK